MVGSLLAETTKNQQSSIFPRLSFVAKIFSCWPRILSPPFVTTHAQNYSCVNDIPQHAVDTCMYCMSKNIWSQSQLAWLLTGLQWVKTWRLNTLYIVCKNVLFFSKTTTLFSISLSAIMTSSLKAKSFMHEYFRLCEQDLLNCLFPITFVLLQKKNHLPHVSNNGPFSFAERIPESQRAKPGRRWTVRLRHNFRAAKLGKEMTSLLSLGNAHAQT